ncbi:radical SAM protein [Longispora sp. NPDC051575]|uniref:B12-binding domain-containing radical SAM protein n=1 Tax=Longispora sp. NPDC051575 TaxID=3154943 RepID=UPI003438002C
MLTERLDAGLISGHTPDRALDLLLVNAPLRDYALRPRVNDFTLPVLGMAYIATAAAGAGFNVGVLDAEAHGLGIEATVDLINRHAPRWVGFNLLAPTYEISARIADGLAPTILVMVGGHQAKAMPTEILTDPRMRHVAALVLGEGESRVVELLHDHRRRAELPGVMWRDPILATINNGRGSNAHLAPSIDDLAYVDRRYLAQDPYRADDGELEANMVGARGCPYDCSFCGAAVSANPDVSIRVRQPANILGEMFQLHAADGVTRFRFVDDLFLGAGRVIKAMMAPFAAERVGDWARWDATGRINVLDRLDDAGLDQLAANGLREVALGIESGSTRMLQYIDKRIDPGMVQRTVRRLGERGIGVKGYFILGFPGEARTEMLETVALVHELWRITDGQPGNFRASVFEFRPYPGTPEWDRLMKTGRYTADQLLAYGAVDLTDDGLDEAMRGRDEFNFSVGIRFGEAPVDEVRRHMADLSREQYARSNGQRGA